MSQVYKFVAFQALIYAIQIVALFLAAKRIGPIDQGTFALFRATIYIFESMVWLGVSSANGFFLSRNFKRYFEPTIVILYFGSAVIFALGIFIVFDVDLEGYGNQSKLLALVWLMSVVFNQYAIKMLIGIQKFNLLNLLTLASNLILLAPILFLSSITLNTLMLVNILSSSLGFVVVIIFVKRASGILTFSFNTKVLKLFFNYGIKGYISSIFYLLLYRIDFYFVGFFLGKAELGIYSVSVFIIESLQKVSDWLSMSLAPKVASGEDFSNVVTYKYLKVSLLYCCGVVTTILALRGMGFDPILYTMGNQYASVFGVVELLLPRLFLHGIMIILAAKLAGSGYTLYHPLSGLLAILTIAILDILLMPTLKLEGAIIAITSAYLSSLIVLWLGFAALKNKLAQAKSL